jgi:multimeric flavodoxin WrbA
MKILIVNGSPRKDGNCSYIVGKLQEKYSEDDVSILTLNDMNIKGCQGCYSCRDNNSFCVVSDELQPYLEKIVDNDLIILLTPNYYGIISAQLKTFLDRWFCLKTDKRVSKFSGNTKLFLIVTQGAPNRDYGNKFLEWCKHFTESFGLKFYGFIFPGCSRESVDFVKLKYDDLSMSLNMFI